MFDDDDDVIHSIMFDSWPFYGPDLSTSWAFVSFYKLNLKRTIIIWAENHFFKVLVNEGASSKGFFQTGKPCS